VTVKAGDTYFTEAGTVHAIGGGITLCEIQQNSDVTYRLYDYGRPRQLHIDKGLDVSKTEPYDGRREYPVVCEHFDVDLLDIGEPVECDAGCDGALIVLEGEGRFGEIAVRPGQVVLITADGEPVKVRPTTNLKVLHAKCGSES
jgi:mannose-6-phosphate isomerase